MSFTLQLDDEAAEDPGQTGGKGANLATLVRAKIPVPPGFCVTSGAFDRFVAQLPNAAARFSALDAVDGSSVEAGQAAAAAMREALDALPMPEAIAVDVLASAHALGAGPVAVRSSATAEDLPGASFAGQQDTYLNIRGDDELLAAVKRCWISLFTDRAVLYRARGGFGHRGVHLAVVVQRLVDPDVSGILFTADPVSGHRHVTSIEAGYGLGEALVSGLISADLYRVDRKSGEIVLATPGDKALAIRSLPDGGTRQESISEERRHARALDDAQVLALSAIGARIEALYGGVPQDIEWCIADGTLHVLQARPITSLFPIPDGPADAGGLRIFLSFGHIQMMLDAMPQTSLEVWRLFFPAGKPTPKPNAPASLSASMLPAGGRLYVDATPVFRVARARSLVLGALSHVYESLGAHAAALAVHPELQGGGSGARIARGALRIIGPVVGRVPLRVLVNDPVRTARRFNRAVDAIPRGARARVGEEPTPSARIRRCAVELNGLFWRVRPHLSAMLAGVVAHRLLARIALRPWADGVRDEVDVLQRGLPWNVTTEMDLAVGDLTDLVRPYPAIAELLERHPYGELRALLDDVAGGPEFRAALDRFIDQYGDRGAGEIDVSRPRWRDDPSLLLRVVLGGLSGNEAGAHRRRHEAQIAAGEAAARHLVEASRRGPLGLVRRALVARLVRVARNGLGLREHPKLILVRILAIVRAEVLAAGATLASRGQIEAPEDIWHLGFTEIADALDDPKAALRERVRDRAEALRRDRDRKPPIVVSSEGETPLPARAKDLPEGALPGTAASSGVVEGIARVVMDPSRETLRAGEILVARCTDPGWTPLFVHAAAVVTEVGGMMTHGAVVAREYGIPAVVSVTNAVDRIKTGQRIRVDGTRGFVQILDTNGQATH